MRLKLKNNSGFTLMELVVVLGVFSISIFIITEIFMFTNRSQKKVLAYQKVQSDASYALETMARAVRLGKIDYAHYTTVNNPEEELYVFDSDGRQAVFEKATGADCANAASSPCIAAGIDQDADGTADQFAAITPKGIKVSDLKFYIVPVSDPFYVKACSAHADCASGIGLCDVATQLCEVADIQPMVTIVLSTIEAEPSSQETPVSVTLQTTVSSREYYR
ncbi:MAG: type II secretion system protein [bacterium]